MFNDSGKFNPVCTDIVGPLERFHDEFNPFSEDGKSLIYGRVVHYLSRAGYVFNEFHSEFYKLCSEGFYIHVDEHSLKNEIYSLIKASNPHFNTESRMVKSIVEEFKSLITVSDLDSKFNEFLSSDLGTDYELDYRDINEGYRLVQLSNGLFNPCLKSENYPFTLLPHCGYYFPPEGVGPYDLDFSPIPESELFSRVESEDFLTIIPDKKTLEFFLWWSGAVLFSYPFRLPMFLLLYGPGGTGKTTIVSCLLSILGRAGGHATLSCLTDQKSQSCFIGKKLNLSSEMEGDYDKRLISSIKEITGGEPIQVEQKYKDPIEIYPPALVFTGNVFPEIDSSDTGVLRRACVINCTNYLEDSGVDWPKLMKDNDHKNWLFNASYYYWVKNKDKMPSHMKSDSMREMEHQFKLINPFLNWVFDYCGTLDKEQVRKRFIGVPLVSLYDSYRGSLYELNVAKPKSKHRFSQKIQTDYDLVLEPYHNVRVFKTKE